jgi:WD40 repeat protein
VPTDASRRFLVAAGTEQYEDGDELASVPDDLRKIAGFFGQLGYSEQLAEIRLNPSSSALRRALSEWLNGSDRQASDTAVIYYSGHGDSQASYFYLLTADSKVNRYADTALRVDYVLEALGENPKVRRILFILDACYAGHGAFDAADVAARMSPYLNLSGDDEGIWVVAAASPKQEAQERLFADAFIEAAEQLQQTTGTLQPYIGLEALIWQVNAILKRRGKQQRASWIPATQARVLAPFIPNIRYEPDAPANVDLETRDWLRRRHAAELAEYWGPKARGVEVAAQAGWYFTGRQTAIEELSEWLSAPARDTQLRVVTGDPGSGKSAVLGRLVTLADTGPQGVSDQGLVPPADGIAAALLARGKTADELLIELAATLGIAVSTGLADTVGSRPVFTVVIDALDEAADPPTVIERVILPLHSAASHERGPRLLVATRRYEHLLESLPEARVTVDLDQGAYLSDTDVAEYVTKVLLAGDDPDSPTPYRDQPKLARAVAREVAAIAGHSFLIAQIAARTLARTPRALDPAEVFADRERWRDVGAAFDRDLDRYGEKASPVRDLLTPLAWAEGAGLPRELWAPLAMGLARNKDYADADITWLLEQAGFYLVETLDQDRSVYRLYHEQFAEHLRAAHSPNSAHKRITAELLRHVPATAEGRREWLAAPPYIRAHLATHAAKASALDQLVNDPGFLLAADPARLLPTLATLTDTEALKSASAFESTQHLLPGQPLGQAAAQLDLAARIHGATVLAASISHLPYRRPWTVAWGHWARPDRHVVLGRQPEEIRAVAVALIDGAPFAVTGGRDGAVRVWDLQAGAARGEALPAHAKGVTALAVGQVDGTPFAVTGGSDRRVRVWDLRTGTARGEPLRGHTSGVTAVAVGQVDGTSVAVTGSRDGSMRVWDLQAGAARGEPLLAHPNGVTAVAVGQVDGTPVAVTGGRDGVVRVWDLRTRAEWRTLRGHTSRVTTVAVGQIDGAPVAVAGSSTGRMVRVWNLRTGAAQRTLRGHTGGITAVAVGELDGAPVAVSGSTDRTVRVWDLRAGTARGEPLRGHISGIAALAVGEASDTLVAVTGGRDGTVRVWDLRAGAARGEPVGGRTGQVTAVAVGQVDGMPVAVTGSAANSVKVWDLATGAALKALRGQTSRATAVAAGRVSGTSVAVTRGADGRVRVWDLRTGRARGKPWIPGGIFRRRVLRSSSDESVGRVVAVGQVDSTPVAVTGDRDGTVRVWDLRTGRARGEPLGGQAGGVTTVAVGQVDGTPVAVTGHSDGPVRVWNLRTGTAWKVLEDHTRAVKALAVGEVDGTPVAVTGHSDGSVRVWNLRTGTAWKVLEGHTRAVKALAVGEVDGIPVAVCGDDNGTISMWILSRDLAASARLDAAAGIIAIAFGGQFGWLIATNDGSLFMWRPASI